MNHVWIVGSPRTGGTWLGKMFDSDPFVHFLWEPDDMVSHRDDQFWRWEFNLPPHGQYDGLTKSLRFVSHVEIHPEFEKKSLRHIVAKLTQALGLIRYTGEWRRSWPEGRFLEMRNETNAKIIHLVRHPIRWLASVRNWRRAHDENLKKQVDLYTNLSVSTYNMHRTKPWYRLVRFEDLVGDPYHTMGDLFKWCGIGKLPDSFLRYMTHMHSKDSDVNVDKHPTIMTKQTVMDRWKTSKVGREVFELANALVEKHWDGIYEPLDLKEI